MILDILLLVVGLALVVLGADWLVDGASAIARRSGISEFVIGLTIVGFGTSCPELVVSLTGAIEGLSDVALGNVIGSNVFNVLLILGLTALISPTAITRDNARRDMPIVLAVTLILLLFGLKHTIFHISADGLSRIDGGIFILIFAGYIYYCFKTDKGSDVEADPDSVSDSKQTKLPAAIGLVIAGLAGLIIGGRLFVDNAVDVGEASGISEKIIAITILAGGTSVPELATCLVAIAKKKDQLALGNILGSNVFNILLILGSSALVRPVSFASINVIDAAALVASGLLPMIWALTGRKDRIDRFEGAMMLACYGAYMYLLFLNL